MEKPKTIHIIGMIHLPGINDEAYAKWFANMMTVEPSNFWFHLP